MPDYYPILEIVPVRCPYVESDSNCLNCQYCKGIDSDSKTIICVYNAKLHYQPKKL